MKYREEMDHRCNVGRYFRHYACEEVSKTRYCGPKWHSMVIRNVSVALYIFLLCDKWLVEMNSDTGRPAIIMKSHKQRCNWVCWLTVLQRRHMTTKEEEMQFISFCDFHRGAVFGWLNTVSFCSCDWTDVSASWIWSLDQSVASISLLFDKSLNLKVLLLCYVQNLMKTILEQSLGDLERWISASSS